MATYTQAQRDALAEAIALGVTEVTSNGETVKYRSLAEMRRLLKEMDADLAAAAGTPKRRYVRVRTSSGV